MRAALLGHYHVDRVAQLVALLEEAPAREVLHKTLQDRLEVRLAKQCLIWAAFSSCLLQPLSAAIIGIWISLLAWCARRWSVQWHTARRGLIATWRT